MKTNKLNLLLILLTLGAFAFSSCEDEFTEEDFLRLQAELSQENAIEQMLLAAELARSNDSASQALQQAILDYQKEGNTEALEQAGLLLSYTVRVESDGNPVPGATVSVSNSATGGKVLEAVSNASGYATLEQVPVGENVIRFTAAGFYSMRAVVDFNPISNGVDYTVIGGVVYPLGRSESSTLEVFANDPAGSVATMTGRVTIQSDASTAASEVPANYVISAVLQYGQFGNAGVPFEDIRFESPLVGTGVVDPATGIYTMSLPATATGLDYDIIIPEIETTQRVAITERDGVKLAAPEFADVLTAFGPAASGNYSDPIYVPGATVQFPAPPAPGAGLAATAFTLIPRVLTNDGAVTFTSSNEDLTSDNTVFRLSNRGAYTAVPTVAVTGGGATTAAAMTANINGYVTSINITNGGSGFPASSPVTIQLNQRDGAAGAGTDLGGLFSITVTSTAAGALPTGAVNILAASPIGVGESKDDPFTFATALASISATPAGGTGAVIAVSYTGYLASLNVTNSGANFTSIPAIAFTGGGTGAVQASVTIPGMQFTYEFGLDNSANTTPYSVLPDNIAVRIGDFYTLNGGIETATTNTVSTVFEGNITGGQDILNHVTISGGAVVPINPGTTFRVGSYTTPVLVVTPSIARRAFALARIGTDDDDRGLLINLFDVDPGQGYNTSFAATIIAPAGATGAGATVSLSGFTTAASGEVTWDGNFEITNRGTNYVPNLNAVFPTDNFVNAGFQGDEDVTVRTGDVITNNIDLGTGARASDVGGEDLQPLLDEIGGV